MAYSVPEKGPGLWHLTVAGVVRVWLVHSVQCRPNSVRTQSCSIAYLGRAIPGPIPVYGGNFRRTFRTVGPYEFLQEKVWTNDWSIWISPELSMDQWRSKFSESFSLDQCWSIECSSLHLQKIITYISNQVWSCNALHQYNRQELSLCSMLPVKFRLPQCPLRCFLAVWSENHYIIKTETHDTNQSGAL